MSDLKSVTDYSARAVNRVRRKFQDTGDIPRSPDYAERPYMFFDAHYTVFLVQKNDIDWKRHPDGMGEAASDYPKSASKLRPALRFSA